MIADVKAQGSAAHALYGTWIFDDGGSRIVAHVHGRAHLLVTEKEAFKLRGQAQHACQHAYATLDDADAAEACADEITDSDAAVSYDLDLAANSLQHATCHAACM